MTSETYNWKRFWCSRTGRINLTDGGYLYDPDSGWGRIYNPDVVPYESISKALCLVLLGEPGIGKSHTMKADRNAIHTSVEEEGGQTLWVDLRAYGSEDRLIRVLFKDTRFVSWAKGRQPLYIFLDSLDECLLRIDNLASMLIEEFKKYPVDRLYLRIACRTADWPNGLEEGLKQLWGNHGVEVYELCPLCRGDVIEAAKANGLKPDSFLHEIDRMEVVPLAIKPVTLGFLINTYRRSGHFPSNQTELYSQGCRLLCTETSQSRCDARLTGNFTAEQRMAVASRIAAVTIFSNWYALWTGIDQGDIPDEDVTVRELYGGKERANGDEFVVNEAAVRETLNTGLFTSRGAHRMGWAHQTYAEFLAAWYLVQHKMTLSQILSLIVHPGDPDGNLVPQLHETAAWLAGMVPDLFRQIMKVDPEVLLRSDVATADVKDRAALVEILLRLYDEEKLLDRDWDLRKRYRKLAHPGLAEQLRPYICDTTKGVVVRRVAIDIAEACELQRLQDDLTDIVLDCSQPLPIRVNAAYAVGRIAYNETKVKLKPLATGKAGDDPQDELKGCGLRAIWPSLLTGEELFALLTPPKQDNFIGAYHRFLSHDLIQHIQITDLPVALKWVEAQPPRHKLPHPFRELMAAIMLKAWQHIESPGVLEAFAKAAFSRVKHYDPILGDRHVSQYNNALSDDEKRRKLLETVLCIVSDPEKDLIQIVYSHPPIVLSRDVPWMIERLRASKSEPTRRMWARLIGRVFDWREPGQLDTILIVSSRCPILAEEFVWLIKPVELDSPEAQKMRADYLEQQKWQQGPPLLEPPPAKRIARLLDEFESGNLNAWWRLNMEMTLEPNSTHYGDELGSDLTILPGWKEADETTRARIVKAAQKYVLEQDPSTHKWLAKNIDYRPATAGYRALRLLFQEAPDFFFIITADVWKRWAPIILAYPTSGEAKDKEVHRQLIKLAYQYAPTEIIESLMLMIDKENREHDSISIIHEVEGCWDDCLANALLDKVKDKKLKPKCMGHLLNHLIEHKTAGARAFAESLIPLPIPSRGNARSRAIIAACVLMTHAEDAGWSVVWPAIEKDTRFGRELIPTIAQNSNERHTTNVGLRLIENQLADLYIWLVRQYPYTEDPKLKDTHWIGLRENVTIWRDSILNHLKGRGTQQSCEAIRKIARHFPELEWLKWTIMDAQTITRRLTWVPSRPADILKISNNEQARLVQNGDQLLDILIESLKRLEAKLQGETPAAKFLWDKTGKHTYRPKDEASFADYVKIHLDEDLKQQGVIVNREVEIRRGEGLSEGERTDIHVDAVVRDPCGDAYDKVTAIIEVKGCWNPKLDQAMKTQLMERYLKDNHCQHGLYLIGWFTCDQWGNDDYRKRQIPKLDIVEAQKKFTEQAAEVSQQGMRIKASIINTGLR